MTLTKAVMDTNKTLQTEAKPTSKTFHYISIGNLSFDITNLWDVYQCVSLGDGRLELKVNAATIKQLTSAFVVNKLASYINGSGDLYFEGPNYVPVMMALAEHLHILKK